jgi:hypothetical protein
VNYVVQPDLSMNPIPSFHNTSRTVKWTESFSWGSASSYDHMFEVNRCALLCVVHYKTFANACFIDCYTAMIVIQCGMLRCDAGCYAVVYASMDVFVLVGRSSRAANKVFGNVCVHQNALKWTGTFSL